MTELIQEWLRKAGTARSEGRLADARLALGEALAICKRHPEERASLVEVLKALGQVERDEGRPTVALVHYQEAAAVCRSGGSSEMLAHTIRHVADILQDLERLAEAEPMYVEALALYRAGPTTSALDLANAVRPLAILRERMNHIEEARQLWLEAKALYAVARIDEGVAESERRLGQLDG